MWSRAVIPTCLVQTSRCMTNGKFGAYFDCYFVVGFRAAPCCDLGKADGGRAAETFSTCLSSLVDEALMS